MYHIEGKNAYVGTISAVNHDKLPVGNWVVAWHVKKGCFYLKQEPDFKIPKKIYGDPTSFVKRILNTYDSKNGNLGVLLKGLKGTGKTLTTTMISKMSGLPTISIIDPFHGTDFLTFLSSIREKAIIVIDEFEKTYPRDDQKHLLTLLDGVIQGNKLFVLTANEDRFHDALINRPGRIHYSRTYQGLEDDVIEDVIEDLLHDKSHKKEVIEVASIVGNINLDSLITLIKEMNLYKEGPRQALKYLNISPEKDTIYKTKIIFPSEMKHYDSEYSGGFLETSIQNPYGGIALEDYVAEVIYTPNEIDDSREDVPLEKLAVSSRPIKKSHKSSKSNFYIDEYFERDHLEITALDSSKLKVKIIEKGHCYEGLEFLLTKESVITYLF